MTPVPPVQPVMTVMTVMTVQAATPAARTSSTTAHGASAPRLSMRRRRVAARQVLPTLTGPRREEVTVADEVALAGAYLRVQATRMEERLRFRIEIDERARHATLLPLLLQPLVENAVRHGLEPEVEGGSIAVRARTEGDSVIVEVRDDGRGLAQPARQGAGMALANVRARLAARFGCAASLTVAASQPGTLATLRLPLCLPGPSALPGAAQ